MPLQIFPNEKLVIFFQVLSTRDDGLCIHILDFLYFVQRIQDNINNETAFSCLWKLSAWSVHGGCHTYFVDHKCYECLYIQCLVSYQFWFLTWVLVKNIPPDPDESVDEHVEHFFRMNHPDHYLSHQVCTVLEYLCTKYFSIWQAKIYHFSFCLCYVVKVCVVWHLFRKKYVLSSLVIMRNLGVEPFSFLCTAVFLQLLQQMNLKLMLLVGCLQCK